MVGILRAPRSVISASLLGETACYSTGFRREARLPQHSPKTNEPLKRCQLLICSFATPQKCWEKTHLSEDNQDSTIGEHLLR